MPPKGKAKARGGSVGKAGAKARSDSSSAKAKAKGKAKARGASRDPAATAVPAATEAVVEPSPPVPPLAPEEAGPVASSSSSAPAPQPAAAAVPIAPPPASAPAAAAPVVPEREPPAVRAQQLQTEVPDPWAAVSDDAAYAKVVEEAWDVVIDDLDAAPGESGPAHVVAKDLGLSELKVERHIEACAVSLDFSGNALERIDALPALWIRSLLLGANQLSSLDGLAELFPRLLCVDLSFVDIPSLDDGWAALAACPRLRSLVAEGAGVSSFEDMATLPSLESLELLENEVEEMSELAVLSKRCPALQKLDLRENPIATAPFYVKVVAKELPKLVWHNNQSGKKYVPKGREQIGPVNFSAEINAVDGLYKNESCSCLEGNCCIDPITCVDWEHREVVAAEARRKKGLRGPAGEWL